MNILKSIGAVLAGFITVVVLSIATDLLLETIGVFPPATEPAAYVTWMLALALVYRTVYTVAGGYVTARLAPNKPMKHAIILGLIGIVAGTAGLIATWGLTTEYWYPIALVVLALPSTWLGGKIYKMWAPKQETVPLTPLQ